MLKLVEGLESLPPRRATLEAKVEIDLKMSSAGASAVDVLLKAIPATPTYAAVPERHAYPAPSRLRSLDLVSNRPVELLIQALVATVRLGGRDGRPVQIPRRSPRTSDGVLAGLPDHGRQARNPVRIARSTFSVVPWRNEGQVIHRSASFSSEVSLTPKARIACSLGTANVPTSTSTPPAPNAFLGTELRKTVGSPRARIGLDVTLGLTSCARRPKRRQVVSPTTSPSHAVRRLRRQSTAKLDTARLNMGSVLCPANGTRFQVAPI